MKTIVCASLSFAAVLLMVIVQNVLFLSTSSLEYLYETISGLELYSSLCILIIMLAFLQRQPVPFVPPVFQKLSKREQEVAVLLLQGKTTQETADALFVSLSTVKTHIQHIYEKPECATGRSLPDLRRIM